jgi:hypothetical protein
MNHGPYGCVELGEACKVLAKKRAVQALIKATVGPEKSKQALQLMKTGNLEGELGAVIHDLLTDTIRNDANVVWSGVIRQPHDDYPVYVHGYHGVFWVWAMEYDPVGYFLVESAAIAYARRYWA